MKIVKAIFILLLSPFAVSAQSSSYLDSLKQVLQHTNNDTVKMDIYRNMGFYLQNGKVDSALYYHQQQLAYAEKLHMKLYEADAHQQMGYVLLWQNELPDALKNYEQALKIASEPNSAASTWGYSNFSFSKTPADARLSIIGMVHYELSTLYDTSKMTNEVKHQLDEALKIGEQLNNKKILALTTRELGSFFEKNNQPDSALSYYQKASYYFNSSPFKTGLGENYRRIANIYSTTKQQYDSALFYLRKAEKTTIGNNVLLSLCLVYLDVGKVFLAINQTDSALHYAVKTIELAQSIKSDFSLANGYMQLATINELLNKPLLAIEYLKKGKAINDSLSRAYINKLIQFQNDGFESQLKLKEIEDEQAAFKTRLKIIGLTSVIVVFLLIAIFLYRTNLKSRAANKLLQQQKREIQLTLEKLESAQSQLIQSEKMASLGELTAGIAHEIQNPLNFVNNFSEVNTELIDEMQGETNLEEIKLVANDIRQNNEKIAYHGKRADAIVKSMLLHSRQSQGVKERTDINALCDEYARLSYHGLRAKDKTFNAQFETRPDPSNPTLEIVPQDIGRVLLNLLNNAFYAVTERARREGPGYRPTVIVSTKKKGPVVEISVEDNGSGVPEELKTKIFQPFFTSKPAGQGTGLGLSLSYDIIKAHHGEIKMMTEENAGTKFILELPAPVPFTK